MIRRTTRVLAAAALAAAIVIPASALSAHAALDDAKSDSFAGDVFAGGATAGDVGDVAGVADVGSVDLDLQNTTVQGNNYRTIADCSVSTVVDGGNQTSSSDTNAQTPESSDCIRRLSINSPGANTTS